MKKRFRIQMMAVLLVAAMLLGYVAPVTAHAEEDYDFTPRRVMVKRDTDIDGQAGMPSFYGNYEPAEETELTEGLTVMNAGTYDLFSLYYDQSVIAIEEDAILSATGEFYEDNAELMELTGTEALWEEGNFGQGVKVAIFDTAVKESESLVLSGSVSFLPEESRPAQKESGISHGTAVASVLFGLVPLAELYSVEVLDADGNGYYSSLIQGIYWAIEEDMDVLVMSLGGKTYSAFLQEALRMAEWHDIVILAAAGNEDGTEVLYPAAYTETLSVGAADASGNPLISYAGDVDCYAIGENILVSSGEQSMRFSGSSAANAVAAAAAVQLKTVGKNLSREQVMALLINTSDDTIHVRKAIEHRTSPIYTRLTSREMDAELLAMMEESLDGEMEALADEYKLTVMYVYGVDGVIAELETETYWYDAGEAYTGQTWDTTREHKGETYTLTQLSGSGCITTTGWKTNSCVMTENGIVLAVYMKNSVLTPTPSPTKAPQETLTPKVYTVTVRYELYHGTTLVHSESQETEYKENELCSGYVFPESIDYYGSGYLFEDFPVKSSGIKANGNCIESFYVNQNCMIVARYLLPPITVKENQDESMGGTPENGNQVGGADPINMITGNFYLDVTDFYFAGIGESALSITRNYNSVSRYSGLLGTGWSFGYESNLTVDDDGNVTVVYADGRTLVYKKDGDSYLTPSACSDTLSKNTDGTWTLLKSDKMTWSYRADGRLTFIADRNGNKISFSYDNNGTLTAITGADGIRLTVVCREGRIRSVTDPFGRSVDYIYDSEGRLVKVEGETCGTTLYAYNEYGMTSITDGNGAVYITNEYDERGRVVVQTDEDGREIRMVYDDLGQENTYIVTATNSITRYQYDENLYVTRINYNDGSYESYTYDDAGNRISIRARSGFVTKYTYDENRNVTSVTNPLGEVTTFAYNEDNLLTGTSLPNGGELRLTYDANGNMTSMATKLSEDEWSEMTYTYDAQGRVVSVTDALGAETSFVYENLASPVQAVNALGGVTTYTYDEIGRRVSAETELGKTVYEYNEKDQIERITSPDGGVTAFVYDAIGNVEKIVMPEQYEQMAEAGLSMEEAKGYSYIYDSMDRVIAASSAEETVTQYTYDFEGNVTGQSASKYQGVTLEDEEYYRYTYDGTGNLVKVTAPDGGVTEYGYDAAGNVISVTYPNGGTVTYTYDALGRMLTATDTLGQTQYSYTYDVAGNVTEVEDVSGYVTYYAYNLAGQIIEAWIPKKEENGTVYYQAVRYTYDLNGQATELSTSADYVKLYEEPKKWDKVTYAYDTAGNVTEVTDENGAKVVYTYDVYSRLISQSVETGEEPVTTWFTYDAMGNLTEVDGYEYTYDKNGNVVRVKTPEGAKVSYTYDADNRLIKTEETVWEDTLTVYKNAARLNAVSGTDGEKLYPGNTLTCEVVLETENGADTFEVVVLYDKERLQFDSYVAKQSGIRVSDDGNGILVITTSWGLAGGKRTLADLIFAAKDMAEGTAYVAVSPESTVTKGKNTHAVSECSGVLAELHLPDYNEDGITDLRDFAILAGMYEMSEEDEGWHASYDITGDGQVTEKDLDFIRDMIFAGLLGTEDIPKEQVSDHSYLPRYEITREQKVRTITYTYNAAGDVAEITDCNGNKVTYAYDSCGRVVSIIDQAGAKSELIYDTMGNPVKVILPEGVTETYTYDSEGRVLTVTDALGATVTYTYDVYGRVKAITDAVGVCTEYEYDIAGNVTKNLLTGEEYAYNVYGEITAYTDAEGNTTTYIYDGQGNVTNVTDALGGVTSYTYRKDGLLESIIDASGAVTSYQYNTRGLIESETDPLGAVTSYLYDKEDCVVKVTEPNGTVTEYEYNTDGNVIQIEATAVDGRTSVLRYLYAMDGSLTASISDTDILTYQYDELGQLKELNKNGVHTLGFGYDSNGNLLWIKESTNKNLNNPDTVTAYTYDLAGRLTEVRTGGSSRYELVENYHDGSRGFRERFTGGTLLAEYTYNADGMLNTMTDGAGSTTTYSYTSYKQVAEMRKVSADGSLLYQEVNSYDGNGSLLERITSGSAVVTEHTGTSVEAEYTYDALDRLIREVAGDVVTTYTYDVMGNRLTKNADGVVTEYTYDLCNKLLSEVTENPAEDVTETVTGITETGTDTLVTTYSYDLIGNLTEKVTPEGTVTYAYDALNQLINVTNPDGTWQSSTYDASGIRSMLSENGITTEYVSFNGLVLAGYGKNAEQTEHYYYGTGLLATDRKIPGDTGTDNSKNLYYYVTNSHGDVIGLTDNNGTLTETYTYDAFGTLTCIQSLNEDGILVETDTAFSRFLYAGEQYDEVADLYYLRARRYDTTVGRFTQEDTYLGDGRNLYVYVQNNPLKYVDPSGYCTKTSNINLYSMLFENPWEPDFSFSEQDGMIETAIENLLYMQREMAIANNSFNFGTADAIADNLTAGIFELDDTPKGKELFYAAGRVRGEIMVMGAELYGAFVAGSNSSSGSTQPSMAVVSSYGNGYATDMSSGIAIGAEGTFLAAASYSAKRAGDAFGDLLDEVLDEFNELEIKNIIKKIPNKLKKYGKCDGFAKRLAKALDDKGIDYRIIRVDSKNLIYSDKAGDYIGEKYHYGIKIGDTVYDNMTPDGMKLQDWLDDLGLSGEFSEEIIRWDYVDEIINR